MRKSTMFISAALTAFALAMLVGVAAAYKGISQTQQLNVQQVALEMAMPKQAIAVQVQDAASIASKFIQHTDLYSVELADFNSLQSYKVTFSSGDIVFVSLSGQVLATQPPAAPVVIVVKKKGGGGGSAPAPAPVLVAAPAPARKPQVIVQSGGTGGSTGGGTGGSTGGGSTTGTTGGTTGGSTTGTTGGSTSSS